MTSPVVEKLRAKAHEYAVNAAAAEERGDVLGEQGFLAVEVALRELADVFDEVLEEAA
jgi:hypothetical protein